MAFVRKNGIHKPKHGDRKNWNGELLEPVAKDVSKKFEILTRKPENVGTTAFTT